MRVAALLALAALALACGRAGPPVRPLPSEPAPTVTAPGQSAPPTAPAPEGDETDEEEAS